MPGISDVAVNVQRTPLSSIVQTVPSKHVEVARPMHVTGIDLPSERIHETVVRKQSFVPPANKIH